MPVREEIEKLLMKVRADRDEAEAAASKAGERLTRLVSGLTPLTEQDADDIRAAAATCASSLDCLRILGGMAEGLRHLLI